MTITDRLKSQGVFLVISSPSGAGKTSICQHLAHDTRLFLSVSMTTRARRSNEIEGEAYHFIPEEEFEALQVQDKFLESAKVFNHYYGTPREPIEKALAAGKDVLLDIDWQGVQSLARHHKSRLVRVFVLPPSAKALQGRLVTRAQDSKTSQEKRMREAHTEISHYDEYDYIIVNEDLAQSIRVVQAILTAERARRERQVNLIPFTDQLLAQLNALK